MLALTDPKEAYRRSVFDARVQGGDTAALVQLCLEHAITGLGGALFAHQRSDAAGRSKALTRALTAITALEMGVDRNAPLAGALLQMYGAARHAVLGSVVNFQPELLASVRQDLVDIEKALHARP
ncbi:flagellin [Altererythrobacter soli]|uniref:Flagellin n=1 Tax=Croceibacterium soli TaxID=1739690 RepID=A0A6I4UUU8_9SPHN|nr:flagellar protein FliS [Croceibacterium soli]MXP41584.1 flagellin [Croceibacterium soli]